MTATACLRHPWFVCLLMVIGAGCARGADEARLKEDLQARLNQGVKLHLLEVVGLRREGSGPLPPGDSGAERVVVYFNTTLRLTNDYAFGAWDQLGTSSLTYVLGATEDGVFGLGTNNKANDLIRAYGSAVYERTGEGWMPVEDGRASADGAAPPPNIDGTAPPSASKQLIDRLAAMVNLPPPGVAPQDDEIIAEELARASENIDRRVKRREHTFTLATGPTDTDYGRYGDALIAAINRQAPSVRLRQRKSQGSVDNAWLLANGEADYALVQGDVAAAAIAGEDVFSRGAPLSNLRAVGGLFPEAIHVVVLASSPIRDISELRGRRVNIGPPASGTRFDAVAVLAAYGLQPADLADADEEGPTASVDRLRRGQLDAIFITANAPVRSLQQLATKPGFRLLPVRGDAFERLALTRSGLTPLTLPANSYPGQKEPVVTAGSAALLLTTIDAPQAEVQRLADLVFGRLPDAQIAGADVAKVSAENELRGVTVPLHPGAARRPR